MRRLLAMLSSWPQQQGSSSPPHLSLEVSAMSPSDTQHAVRYFEMEPDYPFQFKEDIARPRRIVKYTARKLSNIPATPHRLQNANRRARSWEMKRIHGTPLDIRPWRLVDRRGRRNQRPRLPPAPIVKAFIMRQHCRRTISVASLVQLFQQSLLEVEYLHLERGSAVHRLHETNFVDGEATSTLTCFANA